MGIAPGAKLDFEILSDGTLRVRVLARGSDNLFGLLHRDALQARTLEEMDEGIAQAVAERARP